MKQKMDPRESVQFLLERMPQDGDFDISTVARGQLQGDSEADGMVLINGRVLKILTRKEVRPPDIYRLADQIDVADIDGHWIIIAEYITPKAKELLEEAGINFLDRAGNIHLSMGDIFIHVEGRPNPPPSYERTSRAFTKSGGYVIFQFLMDPEAVNLTYRTIAQRAGVALGTIPKLITGLKEAGYLLQIDKKNYKLNEYKDLLNRWVQLLEERIMPDCAYLRCRPAKMSPHEFAETVSLNPGTQWGGEQAAHLLNKYLQPEQFSMFTELQKSALVRQYKLIPDPRGSIYVYQKFWNFPDTTDPYVHPVLIYGELMASGKSRNLKTAEALFNDYLKKLT
jgi:hypothetical protein